MELWKYVRSQGGHELQEELLKGKSDNCHPGLCWRKDWAPAGNIAKPELPIWSAVGLRNKSPGEESEMPLRFRVWESERKVF